MDSGLITGCDILPFRQRILFCEKNMIHTQKVLNWNLIKMAEKVRAVSIDHYGTILGSTATHTKEKRLSCENRR